MAGSLDEFEYISDDGDSYWVRCDVSNANAIQSPARPIEGTVGLPKNIKPRYVLYRSADNLYQRKIIVLSNDTLPESLPSQINVEVSPSDTRTLDKTFYHGERVKFVSYGNDTAIIE